MVVVKLIIVGGWEYVYNGKILPKQKWKCQIKVMIIICYLYT